MVFTTHSSSGQGAGRQDPDQPHLRGDPAHFGHDLLHHDRQLQSGSSAAPGADRGRELLARGAQQLQVIIIPKDIIYIFLALD